MKKKTIEALFASYKENSSGIEIQQEISQIFLASKGDERQELGEKIKCFVAENPSRLSWSMFFEGHRKFWKEIYLIEKRSDALKSLSLAKKLEAEGQPKEIFLEFPVMLCDTLCERNENPQLAKEIKEIWIDVFNAYPEFESLVEIFRNEMNEKINEVLIKAVEAPRPEIIQTLELTVPLSFSGSSLKLSDLIEKEDVKSFLTERETIFNEFGLAGYMEIEGLERVQMKWNASEYVFSLGLSKEVDLENAREELLGQLSDGLGESLEQMPVVVEQEKIYFSFDIERASNLIVSPTTSKKKIKM